MIVKPQNGVYLELLSRSILGKGYTKGYTKGYS